MSDRQPYQYVLEEHKELLAHLEQIESLVRPHRGESAAASGSASLRDEIGLLAESLARHFAGEERGFLADLSAERPEFARELDALGKEHSDLLATVTTLRDLAHSLPDADLVHEVRAGLRDFFARLREHERRETDLVQEAALRDIGFSA